MDLADVLSTGLTTVADARGKRETLVNAYAGNHDLSFASETLRRDAVGRALEAYSENYIKPIVRARTSRLNINALGVVKGDPVNVTRTFEEYSQAVAFEDVERELYREALTTGAAYLLTWKQPGDEYPETIVYGADQMAVIVDPARPRVTQAAVRTWQSGKRVRVDVYDNSKVIPLITRAETTELSTKLEDYIAFGDESTNPWGEVPVTEFRAESIVQDLIDAQNAHNKAIIDLLVSLEYFSKPLRFAAGFKNPNPNAPGHKPAPGEVMKLPEGATLGQLPPADLQTLLEVATYFKETMCEISGTPKRVLGIGSQGMPPSGEMLREEMQSLVSQVREYQIAFGPRWEQHLRLVLRMMDVPALVKVEWVDPLPMSDAEKVALVEQKVTAGWSLRQALTEYGMAAQDIDEMLATKAEEQAASVERQRATFEAGFLPDDEE